MQGAGELAQSAQFPRDAPRAFAGADDEVLSAHLGPISTVHVINGSLWCYTAADLEDMFPGEVDEAPSEDGGLPTWALVVIILGEPRQCSTARYRINTKYWAAENFVLGPTTPTYDPS